MRHSGSDDELYYVDDVPKDPATDVEQTRAEMSETIDAIQERLAPERLSDEARDVAAEVSEEAQAVVNQAVEKIKEAFPELSGQAEQVARDVITHALQEAKESLPALSEQAQETVDHIVDHAIQEAKSAIRELSTQARASVRDATIGRVERMADTTSETTRSFRSNVVTTIKQNPGPAALTALGISWLVMSGSGKGSQASTGQPAGTAVSGMAGKAEQKAGYVQSAASDLADEAEKTAGDMVEQAEGTLSDASDDAIHAASDAANQVQDTAASVTSQVEGTASAAVSQMQSTAEQVSDQARLLPTRIRLMVSSNPVPLGLVAAAIGGVAALVVPETQREQQLLGSARDKLLDQAESAAVDVVEKAKTVAEEAEETVEKEAKYQGLTSDKG